MNHERTLAELLADGLDLCVRARKLDDVLETLSPDHPQNTAGYEIIQPRSATPRIWVLDQYDRDLAAWEERARSTLIAMGYCK